jgi:hypothetical protein
MPWSRPFDEPIQPPKGKALVTLRDAASYIMALPGKTRQSNEWQAAIEALLMAAEDRGPLMHAHVGMMLALHGAKPIPEYDSSKEKHWGRRKSTTAPAAQCDLSWRGVTPPLMDSKIVDPFSRLKLCGEPARLLPAACPSLGRLRGISKFRRNLRVRACA